MSKLQILDNLFREFYNAKDAKDYIILKDQCKSYKLWSLYNMLNKYTSKTNYGTSNRLYYSHDIVNYFRVMKDCVRFLNR